MEAYLDRWESTLPSTSVRSASAHAIDEQTQKALEGLGYVR